MTAPNAAIEIPNLLYRYADAIDAGRFEEAAALFDNGVVIASGETLKGREAIISMWRQWMRLYEDGTQHTRHLVTNPLISLSSDGLSASCHSQWTALQATETFPLQIVASGRYEDRFAIIDGRWQFIERTYGPVDLVGDTSASMLAPPPDKG